MMSASRVLLVLLVLLLAALPPVEASAVQVCNPAIPATSPGSDFVDNGDGTVSQVVTGLVWMRCALGESWDGAACTGTPAALSWRDALQAAEGTVFAGREDWRLPNKKELASLVEYSCATPSVNTAIFPGDTAATFWTSSPHTTNVAESWIVDLNAGLVDVRGRALGYRALLVSSGPPPEGYRPAISGVADQSIAANTSTGAVAFTVSDPDTPAAALVLTAISSNPALVADVGIGLGGSGSNRTVTVTPTANHRGSVEITLTVTDGTFQTSRTFAVTVTGDITIPIANQTCNRTSPPTSPSSDFLDNGDGTVTHQPTGLVWTRCVLGETWDGTACTGPPADYVWRDALQAAQAATFGGQSDWRLPNKKELASLVEYSCSTPSINALIFPGDMAASFWTASPDTTDASRSWIVDLNAGLVDTRPRTLGYHTLAVRGGPAVSGQPWIGIIPDQVISEDTTTGEIPFAVSDPDTPANTLALTATSSNQALVPDGNVVFGGSGTERTVTVTPTAQANGVTDVTVTVSDGTGSASFGFSVTVTAVNDPPVITSTALVTATQDVAYSYTLTATDPDGDSLVFSAPTRPSWLVFDPQSGQLSGTPANADVGSHAVVLRVSDNLLAVDQSFTITVANVNDPPTISGTPGTRARNGVAYSFTPVAADPDPGDSLTFAVDPPLPAWLNLDPATGVLSGTPTFGDIGTLSGIVLSVVDGNGGAASLAPFDLQVSPYYDGVQVTTLVSYYQGNLTIEGAAGQPGDEVAAFDPAGVLCGSFTVTGPGQYGVMAIYGDDPASPGIDEGAVAGDRLTFRIWDAAGATEYLGRPTVTDGGPDPVTWADDAAITTHQVDLDGVADVPVSLGLQPGWNLVSFPLGVDWYTTATPPVLEVPTGTDYRSVAALGDLLATIDGQYESIFAFQDGSWTFYNPAYPAFSTMKSLTGGYGYWIKMTQAGTLTLSGPPLDPAATLQLASGWNLVGYWGADGAAIPGALGVLGSNPDFTSIFGFDPVSGWQFYNRALGFGTLPALNQGKGYWIQVAAPAGW